MSASVDYTITSVNQQNTYPPQRDLEGSQDSSDHDFNNDEVKSSGSSVVPEDDSEDDSGVAFTFSPNFFQQQSNKPNNIALNFWPRRGSAQGSQGTPLTDLSQQRRPSIVQDMMNAGGLTIDGGKCEFHLNVDDVEAFYATTRPRGESFTVGAPKMEDPCEKSSTGDHLSEQLPLNSSRVECLKTSKYWWSPNFNSEVLERHLKKTVIEFLRRRFRVALVFCGLFTLLWMVVFSASIPFSPTANSTQQVTETRNNQLAIYSVRYSQSYVFGGLILFVCIAALLIVTFSRFYAKFALFLSIFVALILMCTSFSLAVSQVFSRAGSHSFLTLSSVPQFAITAVFILVVFTLTRLPIWLSVVLSVVYLIILEGLVGFTTFSSQDGSNNSTITANSQHGIVYISSSIGRMVLYVGLILAGVTTSYLLQVRQVATFWKIAQCVLSQKALDLERDLEEKTILSMMPKHFADGLLDVQVQMAFMIRQKAVQESQGSLDPLYQNISAPFNMCSMDNVSILFADIVDFTKFSGNLSAAVLVGILNDVFCMFDEFVTKYKCEKISTLGDCYFCVSGCPEQEENHADNCVDMGLAIIKALEDYHSQSKHPIRMRVGIHTGSVFCGVMGTKRFKFDVWSRDVRIANQIESISTPGRVLISKSTLSCLSSGTYATEPVPVRSDPLPTILSNLELYYVTRETGSEVQMTSSSSLLSSRPHRQVSGPSGQEWRRKINSIDTVCKTGDDFEVEGEKCERSGSLSFVRDFAHFACLWWRKKKARSAPAKRSLIDQSSSSIMDIQTQLQRCTSYADLAVPHNGEREEEKQNDDIDKDIVSYMEQQKIRFDTYFDSQLHLFTLNFHDSEWEATYRNYGRNLDDGSNGELTEMELGYRITKLSYLLDTLALFVNFLVIMIGSAVCLTSDNTFSRIWKAWLGIFLFGLFVEVTVLVLVFAVFSPRWFPKCFAKRATYIINWYIRSLVALFFIYYPMSIVGISISECQESDSAEARLAHVQMTFFVTIVVLISSITYMEVSHIVKFVGGILSASFAVVMVLALNLTICIEQYTDDPPTVPPPTTTEPLITIGPPRRHISDVSPATYIMEYYSRHVAPEAIILLLLILILLAVVNRMSEVSVRLSFIGRIEASARRRLTRQRKIQAEWLLFNIIPPHVAYKLREDGKFSQNHDCVGVMFASIVNFTQFLHKDENKGEDSLRLLNVIISEFDMLLEREQFASIEKIKTIGSTYMAASGLIVPPEESQSVDHLLDLVEFGYQLVEILKMTNNKVSNFVFEMQIGFNYGPVTSGVVGSQKMLYDIWGDTVNVASRMASTGYVNEIHMPEKCLGRLGPHVKTHGMRRVVNIKGKGDMATVRIRLPLTEKPANSALTEMPANDR